MTLLESWYCIAMIIILCLIFQEDTTKNKVENSIYIYINYILLIFIIYSSITKDYDIFLFLISSKDLNSRIKNNLKKKIE